jgi:septal ring factor EnvC (AmiA/AmiB activator)
MCSAPDPVKPKTKEVGPTDKQVRQQRQDLREVRQDMREQQKDFRQQLQDQIDATREETQAIRQQLMAPTTPTTSVNNASYQVVTAQESPVGAQVTQALPTMSRRRPLRSSLSITPGATATSAGTGLNIGV